MHPDGKGLQNDPEIQEALKEFKAKPFFGYPAFRIYMEPIPPKLVRFVMKRAGGAVKNERQAEYIILFFIILVFILAGYLCFQAFYRPTIPPYDQWILTPPGTPK